MRGTSRASLAEVERGWEPVIGRAKGKALTLGTELFAVVDALDTNSALLRALADPAASAAAKGDLAAAVLHTADKRVVELVRTVAGQRWSADNDLVDGLERLARIAVLASAEATGGLELVGQEVFQLTRALAGQREARQALIDSGMPAVGRGELAEQILGGRSTKATLTLARRMAESPRGLRFVTNLGHLSDLIAERRDRQVANVTTAAPLNDAQLARLRQVLNMVLGRDVELNVTIDHRVVGGLRVQSGSDVVDATVLARLSDARRQLAS